MCKDEIVEEIDKIREAHAQAFNYDLKAMFADWQKNKMLVGEKLLNFQLSKLKILSN